MPEMKNAVEEALNVSVKHSLEVLFLQASGMFCGLGKFCDSLKNNTNFVVLMLCMARYGGEISFGE